MVNKNAKNINNLFYGRFQDYAKNQPKEIKIKDISNESAIKKYWSIEKNIVQKKNKKYTKQVLTTEKKILQTK